MKATRSSRSRVAPDESLLCQFPFADGRGCRMFRLPSHPSLCLFHARQEEQLLEMDRIAAELASPTGEFKTVRDVHHVIAKLFKLVAANRVPARRAQLLSYLAQLLLYSQKCLRQELMSAQGHDAAERTLREPHPVLPRTTKPAPPQTPQPSERAVLHASTG